MNETATNIQVRHKSSADSADSTSSSISAVIPPTSVESTNSQNLDTKLQDNNEVSIEVANTKETPVPQEFIHESKQVSNNSPMQIEQIDTTIQASLSKSIEPQKKEDDACCETIES